MPKPIGVHPTGMSICDIALAHLAYRRAVERNIGRPFRLV